MSEKSIALASEICNRIHEAGPFAYEYDRAWFDQASSQIALIAGDSKVLYVDHNINAVGNDNTKALILAFTEDVIIIVDLAFTAGSNDDGRNLGARVIGRKNLSSLSVGDVTNAIGFTNGDWPKRVVLTLTYGEDSFTLPFRSHSRDEFPRLVELIPRLALDLNA